MTATQNSTLTAWLSRFRVFRLTFNFLVLFGIRLNNGLIKRTILQLGQHNLRNFLRIGRLRFVVSIALRIAILFVITSIILLLIIRIIRLLEIRISITRILLI